MYKDTCEWMLNANKEIWIKTPTVTGWKGGMDRVGFSQNLWVLVSARPREHHQRDPGQPDSFMIAIAPPNAWKSIS